MLPQPVTFALSPSHSGCILSPFFFFFFFAVSQVNAVTNFKTNTNILLSHHLFISYNTANLLTHRIFKKPSLGNLHSIFHPWFLLPIFYSKNSPLTLITQSHAHSQLPHVCKILTKPGTSPYPIAHNNPLPATLSSKETPEWDLPLQYPSCSGSIYTLWIASWQCHGSKSSPSSCLIISLPITCLKSLIAEWIIIIRIIHEII